MDHRALLGQAVGQVAMPRLAWGLIGDKGKGGRGLGGSSSSGVSCLGVRSSGWICDRCNVDILEVGFNGVDLGDLSYCSDCLWFAKRVE